MDVGQKHRRQYLLILFFIFLIFLLFSFYKFFVSKSSVINPISSPTNTQINTANNNPAKSERIIKCQTVVVAPKSTTELFTYQSGIQFRADYRVGATTNEASFKTQIYYDGNYLYLWQPPLNFGDEPKPTNPPGLKIKLSKFDYKINFSELGQVIRFGSSPLSGDHLCREWDDVDPVFELPSDFTFIEDVDAVNKIKTELAKICQVCEGAVSDDAKSACRQNLVCE